MRTKSARIAALSLVAASVPADARAPPMIIFESGSARLTSQAELILDDAVREMRLIGVRSLIIVGGADRQGSAQHNLILSARRGEAVRAALIARGIDPQVIAGIRADGESHPLVPTADGVAERGNRFAYLIYVNIGEADQIR